MKNEHVKGFIIVAVIVFIIGAVYYTYNDSKDTLIGRTSEDKSSALETYDPYQSSEPTGSRLDYQKAKAAGHSDISIYNYIKENPNIRLYNHPKNFLASPPATPTPVEPSSIGLTLAASAITNMNQSQKTKTINDFSDNTGDITVAIRNLALRIDNSPELRAYITAELARINSNKQGSGSNTSLGDIELQLMEISETLEDIERNQ